MKTKQLREEKGIALVLAMLILLVVTLIGISAVNTTTYDNLIAGNKRASEQAFYVGEAGVNEFLGRFISGATGEITDSAESNTNETTPPWRIFLSKSSGMGATKLGAPDANTTSVTSLQTQLDFGVEVKHKVDAANQIIKYANHPVYIAKSYGFSSDGGNKVIEVEIKKSPSYAPPSALYSEMPVDVHGSSTYINGNDGCGTDNKPGIITTTSTNPSINTSGNPTIDGSPATQTQSSIPPPANLPLNDMVNNLKGAANFSYSYTGSQTLTGYSDSWGTPTAINTETPISYDGPMSIIYFNMRPGNNTLKLAGGSHGAGILLVDGNLDINGGFIWYGVIIVTGSVAYTGGGQKNVTGGIMAGESATVEVDIGGNAGIIYCSTVATKLNQYGNLPKITRWRDLF